MFLLILSPHSLGDPCDQFWQFTSIRTTSVEVKLCLCVCVYVCVCVFVCVCVWRGVLGSPSSGVHHFQTTAIFKRLYR